MATKSLVICWASIPAAKLSSFELHYLGSVQRMIGSSFMVLPRSGKTNFGDPRLFLGHILSLEASEGV
jgi:hypothetical protein